jgi:DNA processing protein
MACMRVCEETLAWLTLTRTPGLDARRIGSALALAGGSAAALISAGDDWHARAGLSAPACEYLRRPPTASRAERRWLEAAAHNLIPCTHPRYPRLLQRLPGSPVALYAAGNVDALGAPLLAAVGSRNPTRQGFDTAFGLARALAQRGLTIVSGLAEGIDTAAHRGALCARGATLAVLGSGLDIVYPASNRELAEVIRHEGLLLSEFPLGTPPRRLHFPRRNRTIAGLALGTVVVEAARGSGSLITARAARELGRAVLAVPGSIHNPLARGCHELIKQGARLAETADDILRDLNFCALFGRADRDERGAAIHERGTTGMDKDHKILLDALGFDPADLDMLIVRTGFKPEAVSSMMLILELEGHVQAAPGGRYSRVANRRAGGER